MDFSRLPQYPGDGVPPSGRRGELDYASDCLDALDRLFDGVSSAAEVTAVLYAVQETIWGTAHHEPFDLALAALVPIIRSGVSAEAQRERALEVTDDLRHYLAELPELR